MSFQEVQQLTEEELQILVEYEEEYKRLGNFERIFQLNSNVVHYGKFFEYKRPSNLLLTKYLKCLPAGVSSIQHVRSQQQKWTWAGASNIKFTNNVKNKTEKWKQHLNTNEQQ